MKKLSNNNFFQFGESLQSEESKFSFSVVVLLLITHILLMALYVYANAKILIIFDSYAIISYIYFLKYKIRKSNIFATFTFIEILIHMFLASISFGWEAGFQNWSYALTCAFFLPSMNSRKQRTTSKRPIAIGTIFIFIYYSLLIYSHFVHSTVYELNPIITEKVFVLNTLTTFFIIIGFTYFYVTKSNIIEKELSKRANYDKLTSLYNRYALSYIGDNNLKKLTKKHPKLDVAIIDIDHFKNINDTYGHKSGDIVLKKLAKMLRMYSIKEIKCGRWGGEEFLLISNTSISHDEFINIVEDLREYIGTHKINIGNGNEIKVTISVGIAQGTSNQSFTKIVSLADKNLYKAKNGGRNKVVH